MSEIQNTETIINTAPNTEVVAVEKKERKKKDVSGGFRSYATVNPFNDEVVVKRFRETETPFGVVFVKYLEGTPERSKFAEFADGSSVWTWTTQQKRFDSTIAILSSGKVKFIDKDNVKGQTTIAAMAFEPEIVKEKRERKPRVEKEKQGNEIQEFTGFNKMDPTQHAFEFFGSEEEEIPTGEPAEEVPQEATDSEQQQFSERKDAVEYAKTLGYSKKQIGDYVRKIDGFWTVVQS